jgi:hypothetical protein
VEGRRLHVQKAGVETGKSLGGHHISLSSWPPITWHLLVTAATV